MDRRSSIALHDARINLIGRDNRVMRFDADRNGQFGTRLPEGVYDLVISARGYLSLLLRGVGVLAGHHHNLTRALVPGEGKHPESFPATAIGGYITDRFGRPVPNINVKFKGMHGEAAYTTRTERDGAYLFDGVVPESYLLTITVGNRRLCREQIDVENARDFVRHDLRLLQA